MTCCTFFVVSHQSYASRPFSFRVSVRTPDRDAQRVSSICERRTLACCTYSAPWMLLEASVTSAEAARGRAFIDPNMAGRSHGLRSCFSVRPSFESRTMIVPHQSPSACQTELTGSSSSSTVVGDQRNLLMSVRFVRPGHYDGACRHRPIAPELFPFQATCALKRKVFPRFWLRDDIARKAAQMIGQVGTGAPLVLVCLALLRSSAGRRRLNKKEKKRSHLAWAATLPGRHKKYAFARRAFVSGGGLRRNAKGRRRVFVPGLAV